MSMRAARGAIGLLAAFVCLPLAAAAQSNAGVEAYVREYFADSPVMANIAQCESRFRQYADSGAPLYGGAGGRMIGVFQIHTTVHERHAKTLLGYDIATLDGNLGYAKYLYQTEGTTPWNSSRACWGGMPLISMASPVVAAVGPIESAQATIQLTRDLLLGMEHEEVRTLQRLLNSAGFQVAVSGPGASGEETTMFGALTRAAVQRFQCEKGIVCEGDERTTGYGLIGPRTRVALLATPHTFALAPSATALSASPLRSEQEDDMMRLQAQIAELQKVLADLAARNAL